MSYKKDSLIFFIRSGSQLAEHIEAKKIKGAKTFDDAKILVVDAAFEFASRPSDEKRARLC